MKSIALIKVPVRKIDGTIKKESLRFNSEQTDLQKYVQG